MSRAAGIVSTTGWAEGAERVAGAVCASAGAARAVLSRREIEIRERIRDFLNIRCPTERLLRQCRRIARASTPLFLDDNSV
jgi:hypothetical protein